MIYLQTEYIHEDSTQITSWNMTSQSPLHVAFQALTPHSPHETNPDLYHHELVSLFGTKYKWGHKLLTLCLAFINFLLSIMLVRSIYGVVRHCWRITDL